MMDKKIVSPILGILLILSMGLVDAAQCPYTGAQTPTEYAKVNIYPVEKYVGAKITIKVIDIDRDKSESLAKDRIVVIYYIQDEEVVSEYNEYTNANGEVVFVPSDSGKYAVATSGRYLFFDVKSKCGDGSCSSDESRTSCARDCASCGDGVCDNNENKGSCPKDCIICGDNSCDSGENRKNCPDDCANCGDGVCDINENKVSCPNDCIVCGDGKCDPEEILSLHITTCPIDCSICGDGYCDESENVTSCFDDCKPEELLDLQIENASQIPVCGDGNCSEPENKDSCPKDCVICGDGICDLEELNSLHQTNCSQDCLVCGDGYCDKGEEHVCEEDCQEEAAIPATFLGYFLLPLVLVFAILYLERKGRDYASTKKSPNEEVYHEHIDSERSVPKLIVFAVTILIASIILLVMGVGYEKNLAVLDLGLFMLHNSILVSAFLLILSLGMGFFANGIYRLKPKDANKLAVEMGIIGLVPGLLLFHNLEFIFLFMGMLAGLFLAAKKTKELEVQSKEKKSFALGSAVAEKSLWVASIFLCLGVFIGMNIDPALEQKISNAVWNSEATKEYVFDNYGRFDTQSGMENSVIRPMLSSSAAGISGRMALSASVALLLLVILRAFIVLIKLLSGFFCWALDRAGLA